MPFAMKKGPPELTRSVCTNLSGSSAEVAGLAEFGGGVDDGVEACLRGEFQRRESDGVWSLLCHARRTMGGANCVAISRTFSVVGRSQSW